MEPCPLFNTKTDRKRSPSPENGFIETRSSKIPRTIDASHNPESYITLIIEEDGDEDVELRRRTFWNSPVTDVEGVSDITGLFLSIVRDPAIQKLLTDEKVLKRKVWEKVAAEMSKLGYPLKVSSAVEAGYRCNVKWKNLCRMHSTYLKEIKSSAGLPSKRKPRYFDVMNALLSNRCSDYSTVDSSFSPILTENTSDELLMPSDTSHCVNRASSGASQRVLPTPSNSSQFLNATVSSPTTPASSSRSSIQLNGDEDETKWYTSSDVIEFLRMSREKDKEEREEDKKEQNYQFTQLMARLDRDYELKEKLVDLFEQFLQTKTK